MNYFLFKVRCKEKKNAYRIIYSLLEYPLAPIVTIAYFFLRTSSIRFGAPTLFLN